MSTESASAQHAVIASFVGQVGGLLQALRAVQASQGFISGAVQAAVADVFNVTKAEVRGVVSYYDDLREAPAAAKVVRICQSEACQAVGARALTTHAQAHLDVALGGTSADRAVTLEPVYCLGLCACGPAVQIGERLLGRVDAARFDAAVA